ncbi:MAG TPA: hypothetical protein VGM63_09660 [Mucilaginibacter sp.]|jgi:hypothetical protein
MGADFFSGTPKQIQKDKAFIINEINPYISTIDSFKKINNRLPSVSEFGNIKHSKSDKLGNAEYIREDRYVSSDIKELVKNTDWSDNYVLAVWRGEWFEYYISKNHKYITNNYSKKDGMIGLIICLVVGCIPAAINFWFVYKHVKK